MLQFSKILREINLIAFKASKTVILTILVFRGSKTAISVKQDGGFENENLVKFSLAKGTNDH